MAGSWAHALAGRELTGARPPVAVPRPNTGVLILECEEVGAIWRCRRAARMWGLAAATATATTCHLLAHVPPALAARCRCATGRAAEPRGGCRALFGPGWRAGAKFTRLW